MALFGSQWFANAGADAFSVDNSAMFNDGDSEYLNKTFGSPSSASQFGYSFWVKLGSGYAGKYIISADGSGNNDNLYFDSNGKITIQEGGTTRLQTNQVLRDQHAWYNVVVAYDLGNGTNDLKLRLYINGTEVTSFATNARSGLSSTSSRLNANGISHDIAANVNNGVSTHVNPFDGYLAEFVFLDGTVITPSDVGETDSNGVWRPIDVSGLTFGNNGFYLPFTNSAGLGQDYSGSTAETKVQENTYNAGSEVNNGDMSGNPACIAYTAIATAKLATVKINSSSRGFTNVTVQVQTDNGSNAPNGTTLTNGEATGIAGSGTGLKTVDFPNGGPDLVAGTKYWICVPSTDLGSGFEWGIQHDVSGSGGALGIIDGTGYQAGRGFGHEVYQLGNIFTPVNSPTQTSDSPTKNYAVLSPLSLQANIALSEGNLKQVSSSNSQGMSLSSFPVTTGQKVYIEATLTNTGGELGCLKATATTAGNPSKTFDDLTSGDARLLNKNNGNVFNSDGGISVTNYAPDQTSSPTTHMIALDLVNDKIYWGDASVGSSGWSNGSGSYNQAFGSAVGVDLDANLDWFFAFKGYNATIAVNFGQTAFTVSPPTGYSSGYSAAIENENRETALTIQDGSAHFQPTLYEGNGGSQSITQDGTSGGNVAKNSTFKPDLLWTKKTGSGTGGNALFDVVRTDSNGQFLRSDNDDAEDNEAGFGTFDVKGFSWDGAGTAIDINTDDKFYVAWQWLADNTAGGASNGDGNITGGTTISVNTTAGFSIVKWTGNNTDGATIGHGLGKPPAMMIYRKTASAQWMVQHAGCTGGVANGGSTKQIMLEAPDAQGGPFSGGHIDFENSGDGSSTVTLQKSSTFNNCNASGAAYISYMFAEIPGYSKFGSFEGNGASGTTGNGPFIELGFRPALVVVKNIDNSTNGHWVVMDSSRNKFNVANGTMWWSLANGQDTGEAAMDFLSNGVKVRGGTLARYNANNETFIYMAWAENPFAGTTPVTAR